MATKLKNMKLTSVDLVRAGANQEADICLYKSAEPPEATERPTEPEEGLIKRFINWLKENPAEAEIKAPIDKEEPQEDPQESNHATFDEVTENQTANDTLDLYLDAIEDSIESIQFDDSLDETRKNEVMLESLQEFITAMEELVPELCKTRPDHRTFEETKEEPKEEVKEINKSADIDVITEVAKYNHNHGADGRFSSGNGGGSGSSAGGSGKFDARSAEATLNAIGTRRINGGAKDDDWKTLRDILQSAPVGTVMTSTGNRGAKSQTTKTGEDEWTHPDGFKMDSKTESMTWGGSSTGDFEFKFDTKDTAPSAQEVRDSQLDAANGQLDQWARGNRAQQLGRY